MGFPQCKTSRTTTKATGATSLLLVVLCKAGSQYISQKQVGFEHMLKLSNNLLIFLMVNTFYSVNAGLKLRPG